MGRREVRERLRIHCARRGGTECELQGNRYVEKLGPQAFAPRLEMDIDKVWNGTVMVARLRPSTFARVLKSFALSAATLIASLAAFIVAVSRPADLPGTLAVIGGAWALVVGAVFTLVDFAQDRATESIDASLTVAQLRRVTLSRPRSEAPRADESVPLDQARS